MERAPRYDKDERTLYRRLWDAARDGGYAIKGLVKAILLIPEYLGNPQPPAGTAKSIASNMTPSLPSQ